MSLVKCHISNVTCRMSHVTCHMSNLQNIVTLKPIELGAWNFETMFTTPSVSHVTRHMSRVTCHMWHVTCHMSHVTCHMSHVTCRSLKHHHSQTIRARDLTFWHNVHHLSRVMCHVSHVNCHLSPVTRHLSHLIVFNFFFIVEQVGGGSVINGAYPV